MGGEYNGDFDVKIEGLGLKTYVKAIENTQLKAVGKFIPTVAEVTQGEVISFVQGALDTMSTAGFNILVEGREQTSNYIRTPHRFELMLDDPTIIGMRRAAQVMGAYAAADIKKGHNKTKKMKHIVGVDRKLSKLGDDDVEPALDRALTALSR